jgi:Tfp pilus assembly protein PilX
MNVRHPHARRPRRRAPAARQRGVALIVGLVILVVLAMLGVSAYSVATQDERLAGNARDHARAMDAAQAMLRACEQYIVQNAPTPGAVQGFLPAPTTGTWFALDLVNNPTPWSTTYTIPNTSANFPSLMALINSTTPPEWAVHQPSCIAEVQPLIIGANRTQQAGVPNVAHISVQGYGLNSSTVVTLESYVKYY